PSATPRNRRPRRSPTAGPRCRAAAAAASAPGRGPAGARGSRSRAPPRARAPRPRRAAAATRDRTRAGGTGPRATRPLAARERAGGRAGGAARRARAPPAARPRHRRRPRSPSCPLRSLARLRPGGSQRALEAIAQLLQRQACPLLHRAERRARVRRDRALRQSGEVREDEDAALLLRQSREGEEERARSLAQPHLFREVPAGFGGVRENALDLVGGDEELLCRAPPQLSHDDMARDRHEPGGEAATSYIELVRFVPEPEVGLLHDVLGLRAAHQMSRPRVHA